MYLWITLKTILRNCILRYYYKLNIVDIPGPGALSQSVPGFRQQAYTDWLTVGN